MGLIIHHVMPLEIFQQVIHIAIKANAVTGCQLALVCKAFQQLSIPLLYRDVILCTESAFQKFRETLVQNQCLGNRTRSIWVGSISNNESRALSSSWDPVWLESCLVDVLSRVPHLKRLALVNLPAWSTAAWEHIESNLPAELERLAAGPEHAILADPTRYPSLKWLCSIDTMLSQEEFNVMLAMPKIHDFHWCFIGERIDLRSVRCLANTLNSRSWNSVGLYIIEGDEVRFDEPEDVELELVTLYENQRVKRYQLFHVEDWCAAFFWHWTIDWIDL